MVKSLQPVKVAASRMPFNSRSRVSFVFHIPAHLNQLIYGSFGLDNEVTESSFGFHKKLHEIKTEKLLHHVAGRGARLVLIAFLSAS